MIHNECSVCGKDFGSVGAFDAHRVGKHEYLYAEGLERNPPLEDGRRCLTGEEMLSGAWGIRHTFALTPKGTWSLARDIERGRAIRHAS